MTRPSTLILPLCVALAVACSGDGVGIEPQSQDRPVLSGITVTPPSSNLFPDYTSQLTIRAWDQFGKEIPEPFEGAWTDRITFSSGAPEIAEVSSRGLVTGLAPGTAEITATLALGGITRTASMLTEIWEQESFSGVYDLTAPITADGWGNYDLDIRYTAVLTLRQDSNDPSRFEGTYEGLQLLNPDGVPLNNATSGAVSGSIKRSGEVSFALVIPGMTDYGWWYGLGTLGPGQVGGTWSEYGMRGTFTAVRREQNAEDR
ncbi:hypothetical protein BH23GEM2_BH23GEM2_26310 [soil metagenome]